MAYSKRDAPYIAEAIAAESAWSWWHDEQAKQTDETGLDEAIAAEKCTLKWHAIYDWAFEVLEWDSPVDWHDANPRVTRVRATIVKDTENEEEAFKRAIPVELIDDWLATVRPPTLAIGGRRRVVIRLLTWVMDRDNNVAYDAEWLKIGDDMSAQAATARALRWAKAYGESLINETASREIRMTQVEIVWWTSVEREKDV